MIRKILVLFILSILVVPAWAQFSIFGKKDRNTYVEIRTDYGVSIVKLYNQTPKHRDNFIKLVKDDFYDGLLFHRVIEQFMIQGGDPDSKNAEKGAQLGDGTLGYTIEAEFRDSLFHKKGALAAARDDNPEKASSANQFYLVQGKVFTDEELDRLEEVRLKGRQIPEYQREVYKTIGGVPHLDQNYTVFGEVVQGIEIVDQIAGVPTDEFDRPVVDQRMQMRVLRRGEARRLERQLEEDR
ncbi:peptidylprolyl isomerase [Albibacterium profundi]|uniref:peptidylprolyl isomerase n=1 Tax=Albibacterium profundi TaxID=3134906 RepID=A0ABV5CCR3_9SPHI